jgi:hypothetical protein
MPTSEALDSVSPEAHSTKKRGKNSQAITAAPNISPRVLAGISPVALTAEPQVARRIQAYACPVESTAAPQLSASVHAEKCPVSSIALPMLKPSSTIYSKKYRIRRVTMILAIAIIVALLATSVGAATDCDILNSGFPVISATNCCDRDNISCLYGRVVRLYVVTKVNSL